MAFPAHLKALIVDAANWDSADRSLYLAVIGEIAETLPANQAIEVARFMIDQLSSPHDGGKIIVIDTIGALARKFGGHPSFVPFLETVTNELGLCLLGTKDPRVLRFTERALNNAENAPRPKKTQLLRADRLFVAFA